MRDKIYESRAELEKDLGRKETIARKKEGRMSDIMEEIERKRERINQLYDEKKDILNNIRKLIDEGKDHQKKRDEIRSKISPKRQHVKDFKKDMGGLSAKVSDLKKKRDEQNARSKGKYSSLKKHLDNEFKTLLTADIGLKEEILLYNHLFEIQERTRYAKDANQHHKDMVQAYKELKERQDAQWNIYQEINERNQKAQEEHFTSIGKFKEKEELSKQMDVRSKEIANLKQEINDLYLTIEAVKISKNRVDRETSFLKMKKARIQGDKIPLSQHEKLTLAKDKMKKEKKMGLDDLRLLITSGTIGGKDGKKGKGRRRR